MNETVHEKFHSLCSVLDQRISRVLPAIWVYNSFGKAPSSSDYKINYKL